MNQIVRSGPMQFDYLDELLQHATQAREVAGVVAVATSDRETLYEGAFGLRDITNTAPMKVDTVFWIASMTKAITATAAMQLVETGKLDLDEPVGRLLPGWLHRRCWRASARIAPQSFATQAARSRCATY